MSTTSSNKGSHFVLVHGAAHGAWCWYRIRCLLECTGHKVTCPDLRGSGIDPTDPDTITTFEEYNQPLDDILSTLPEGEKVILVGHSAGGLSLTGALHKYPHKVLVAVFVGAAMYKNGFDFNQYGKNEGHELRKADDMKAGVRQSLKEDARLSHKSILQLFWTLFCHPLNCLLLVMPDHTYKDKCDGNEVHYNDTLKTFVPKEDQGETIYQLSPLEDRTLAAMLIRPFPSQAIRSAKFEDGNDVDKVPRVYIKTLHDRIYSQEEQDRMIKNWPPHQVYEIDSDHFPLFSNPFQFFGLLLKVANNFGCN